MATKNMLLVTVFCSLALSSAIASTEGAGVFPARLTVAQIVAKNVAARGGLAAWRKIQSISMSGSMDAGKAENNEPKEISADRRTRIEAAKLAAADHGKMVQVPFLMELKRPRKVRFEIQFRGETAVQAYDGTNGWKLRPFLGRREVEPYTPAELKLASAQQELDGPLIDHVAKGNKVEYASTEPVEGRKAYKLKVTLKDGQVRHVWVDAQTFLDVKIDGSRNFGGKSHTVATFMRDYKAVKGLMVPYLLETTVDGVKGSEKIAVEQVALNPKLDDTLFAKPRD